MSILADRISSVLTSPATRTINFHLGGLLVTPQGFADVAYEIRAGRIHLARSSSLPPDAGAVYRIHENRLVVCAHYQDVLNQVWGCSVLVHESVHAMIDRNRAAATTALTGEAAAYIAQTLYRLHRHDGIRTETRENRATAGGAIFIEAIRLIDTYHLEYRFGIVPWPASAALREAINRHPLYQDLAPTDLHQADGLD